MSILVNGTTSQGPIIDPRISSFIHIVTTAEIPTEICIALHDVFTAVADVLEQERRSPGNNPVNCIFSDSDSFQIEIDKEEVAICMRIAFYPIERLRPLFGTPKLYAVLAEELCHLIWNISDETLVVLKVLQVIDRVFPGITVEKLYGKSTEMECLKYLESHPELKR